MKKKLTVKQWIGAIILLLLFILLTIFLYNQFHEDNRFQTFTNNFFLEELCSNPIHLHYMLSDASAYSIDESSLTLPVYRPNQVEENLDKLEETVATLESFHPERLSAENQYTYVLLLSYIKTSRNCASYFYFDEPLSPSSGIQSELPVLLAEYRIASVKDIENYLSILSQIPSYLEGIACYEQEKADHGLFMSDNAADKVIEQCSTLMNPTDLESGGHFLEVTFKNRLGRLVEQQIINESEALAWQSENNRLLTTVVAPAYDKLADELTLLKGSGTNSQGLCYFPDGQEYYQEYLHLTTGSYRSISEMKTMLSEDFGNNYTALISLLKQYPSLKDSLSQETVSLLTLSPEEMLTALQSMMTEDYPAIPFTNSATADCTIKYVDDCLEDYTAPAFYLLSPMDNSKYNTIYINEQSINNHLSLFTTLAHEGYPGHLYQTVYSRQYLQQIQANPVRNILHYGGYTEGWAMYVELNSYDFAIRLSGKEKTDETALFLAEKLNRQVQLCLYSLLDIVIHYEGASQERVGELLSAIGLSNEQTIRAIYEYIVEEPCNYLKYYFGYLEIEALKNQAETAWGNSYSLYRFHSFLLNNGPADFRTLSKLLSITVANP
ncbi:MAG: DUF885 domain-containing protein [Lachnospiraceae bacterium]|nr:DUF885 domain-containing protein [Lachnospiraceae bacterium]